MAATTGPASAMSVSGWPEDQDGRGLKIDAALARKASSGPLSIPKAIGEEKRLHSRDGDELKRSFRPRTGFWRAPASVSEKIRAGKPTAVALRRVMNLRMA
jgi:hypothetical protein